MKPRPCATSVSSTARTTRGATDRTRRSLAWLPSSARLPPCHGIHHHVSVSPVPASARPPPPTSGSRVRCISAVAHLAGTETGTRSTTASRLRFFNRLLYGRSWRPSGLGCRACRGRRKSSVFHLPGRRPPSPTELFEAWSSSTQITVWYGSTSISTSGMLMAGRRRGTNGSGRPRLRRRTRFTDGRSSPYEYDDDTSKTGTAPERQRFRSEAAAAPCHAMPLPRAHAGARWGRGAERGETGGAVKSLIAVLPGASAAPQAIHVM